MSQPDASCSNDGNVVLSIDPGHALKSSLQKRCPSRAYAEPIVSRAAPVVMCELDSVQAIQVESDLNESQNIVDLKLENAADEGDVVKQKSSLMHFTSIILHGLRQIGGRIAQNFGMPPGHANWHQDCWTAPDAARESFTFLRLRRNAL